jgi:hypothetical protein
MYVYAVGDFDGNIKIGWTRGDLSARIEGLARKEKRPLRFLGAQKFDNDGLSKELENQLKRAFWPWLCRGYEWFKITESQLFEQFTPDPGLQLTIRRSRWHSYRPSSLIQWL